jgi:hypothetical protein
LHEIRFAIGARPGQHHVGTLQGDLKPLDSEGPQGELRQAAGKNTTHGQFSDYFIGSFHILVPVLFSKSGPCFARTRTACPA